MDLLKSLDTNSRNDVIFSPDILSIRIHPHTVEHRGETLWTLQTILKCRTRHPHPVARVHTPICIQLVLAEHLQYQITDDNTPICIQLVLEEHLQYEITEYNTPICIQLVLAEHLQYEITEDNTPICIQLVLAEHLQYEITKHKGNVTGCKV